MENKHIEHLTKSSIEHDIKDFYISNIKSVFVATLFLYLGILFMWFSCDLSKKNSWDLIIIAIFSIYIILILSFTVYFIHIIKQYLQKDIKYTVVTDTFTKIGRKHKFCYGIFGMPCMCFSKHGKFILHFYRKYYKWSVLYNGIEDDKIIDRSTPGDKFYLVIKNKRILNVYNQNMFIFNDK